METFPENRCSSCGAEREPLVFKCPRCGCMAGDYEKGLAIKIAEERKVRLWLIKWAAIIFGTGILSLTGLFYTVWTSLRSEVHDLIAADFQERQIQAELSRAAQATAEKMMANVFNPKLHDAETEIRQLTQATADIKTELSSRLDFEFTLIAAQADDRHAWDKLGTLAAQDDFPFRNLAANAYGKVLDENGAVGFMLPATPHWYDTFGPRPTRWELDAIRERYKSLPAIMHTTAFFVLTIAQRTELSTRARTTFMMEVARETSSIEVLRYAGIEFLRLVGDTVPRKPFYPLLVPQLFGPEWEKIRLSLPDNDSKPLPKEQE